MRIRRRSRKAACNLSQVPALSARNRCSRKLATSSNAQATEKMCNFGDTLAQGTCYKGEEGPRLVLLTDSSSKGFVWFGEEERCGRRMRERSTQEPVKAQLRSASDRSSKVIKDRESIEAVVEVPGAGRLVLLVDSRGGYSLRGRLEGLESDEAARQGDLIAVGVLRANGIVNVHPERGPTPPSTS
jgi:hypothetical protein